MLPYLLYILSPSYSGSTLLTFLLAAHPEIATVGELKASALGDIITYRCSCGEILTRCAFWSRIRTAMQQYGTNFAFTDFGTHFKGASQSFAKLTGLAVRHPLLQFAGRTLTRSLPNYERQLNRIVERNRMLITLITKLQGGQIFLDSSKDPERLAHLQNRLGMAIKVVRLIRDGRGITNSYMKHYGVGMQIAAKELVSTQRACDRVLSRFASADVLDVRYESLCDSSEESITAILGLVGLRGATQSAARLASGLHILGNDMRLRFSESLKSDRTWKSELSPGDLGIFEKTAGNVNRERGYTHGY